MGSSLKDDLSTTASGGGDGLKIYEPHANMVVN